jgi:hypothetical protein
MSASALLHRIPFTVVISLAAAFVGGPRGMAEEFSGLVGGLTDLADMQPLVAAEAEIATPRQRPAAGRVSVRQSVPSRDRASLYRHNELFEMSRVATPLLVADLEPTSVVAPRPMSGRSVGARTIFARPNLPIDSVSSKTASPQDASRW